MDEFEQPSSMDEFEQPSSKSWSIHTRREITSKYEILEQVGSGAYSDVYRARRRSDSLIVALKEVHDYTSAFREIDALQTLRDCPNVVVLLEYFWRDDEDAVLVLEYLQTDLTAVIKAAKKEWEGGLTIGEVKQWMLQILQGIDACHSHSIVHRDLKPSNLLISSEGVLKIADFGQAISLLDPISSHDDDLNEYCQLPNQVDSNLIVEQGGYAIEQGNPNLNDAATCTTSDQEDPYEAGKGKGDLTSCVGTRWFRSPELLFGSTTYGLEVDIWSVGCIFAELLNPEPIFPGTSDIDQLGKIFNILGNLTEQIWPGCIHLPDYRIISFEKVEKPIGLEGCLKNRSPDEVDIVKKLLCFDPAGRATASELLRSSYLNVEPLPAPLSELRVPSKHGSLDGDSDIDFRDFGSDSNFDDFGSQHKTENGFSIRFYD